MDSSHVQQITIKAAVLTISSSRTDKSDTAGEKIKELLKESGIQIVHYEIIPDQISAIRRGLIQSLQMANCIILSGGTGITEDDCTIEAVEPLLEKRLDGFGELFRMKSLEEVGARAILSRTVAGIIDGKAVFCIPGSFNAAELATKDLIIPEIKHILTHANK